MQHIQIPSVKPILYGSVAAMLNFTVNYNSTGIANGVLKARLSASAAAPLLVEFSAEVTTVFNAVTTNVLTVGSDAASANQFLASGDITEGTVGFYPASNAVKKYRLTADTDIYVKYTQTGEAAQVETQTIVITSPGTNGAGTIALTFVSALTGTLSLAPSILANTTTSAIAIIVAAALNANATFAANFIATVSTANVIVTALVAAANDLTLNLAYTNGTCTGLTADTTSADTTPGVAYATTGAASVFLKVTPLAPIPSNVLNGLS